MKATTLPPAALALWLIGCAPAAPPAPAPAPVPLPARTFAETVDLILADTALAHAHWGVLVRSLDGDSLVYARSASKLFTPASNMKLLTGAAALEVLGPAYRYRTEVSAAGQVSGGVLLGDLVVSGAGDPTVSERFHHDPRAVFRGWADSLRVHGVRRIAGDVVGIDRLFDGVPLGSGWAWDDLESAYAAGVAGLYLNEGVVRVTVRPGPLGASARVSLDPPTGYLPVTNSTRTSSAGGEPFLTVERNPAGRGVLVEGEVTAGAEPVVRWIAVRDPAGYFAAVLRETLESEGVEVSGRARVLEADETGPAGATFLFAHLSPPLEEVLPELLKPSQNQIAEILLKTVGLEARGEGSARAGAEAVDSLLAAWGVKPTRLRVADGSGLSRYNLLSPELLVSLLERMDGSRYARLWRESLPLAGVDGTLENRLRGTAAEGRVRAKTGSLSNVRALSGYLTTSAGERMVFSTLVNGHLLGAAGVDRVVDDILLALIASP